MDLMGIIVWLAVLVSLVVFILMVVKSVKSWGALHTTLLILLFLQVWSFLFFTAGVASRRNGYMRAYELLKKKVIAKEIEANAARWGDRVSPNTDDLSRYVPVTNELNRLLIERGRVWRGATLGQINAGEATLQLAVNRLGAAPVAAAGNGADGAAPAAAGDSGLAPQTVIHAFGENADPKDPTGLLPTSYFGEFSVTESSNGVIKLKPTNSLTKEQQDAIASGSFGSWAIYELMPLDSHGVFAAEGSKTDDNAIFGRMDSNELSTLLRIDPALATAEPSGLNAKDAIKSRVLQSYLNDGGRPPEGTPPEQVYVRVEFLKDHTIEVDAQDQRNATEGGYFDLSGRSVDARLKRGEDGAKVAFKAEDKIVFDSTTADELVKQGFVKVLAPVYVRPLNDYEYAFRELRRQITLSTQDAKLIERELAEMQKSQGLADNQVRLGQDERSKLDKDFAQYKKENDVITAEASRLNDLLVSTRSEVASMFQQIQTMRDRIVSNQKALSDAINAATAINP